MHKLAEKAFPNMDRDDYEHELVGIFCSNIRGDDLKENLRDKWKNSHCSIQDLIDKANALQLVNSYVSTPNPNSNSRYSNSSLNESGISSLGSPMNSTLISNSSFRNRNNNPRRMLFNNENNNSLSDTLNNSLNRTLQNNNGPNYAHPVQSFNNMSNILQPQVVNNIPNTNLNSFQFNTPNQSVQNSSTSNPYATVNSFSSQNGTNNTPFVSANTSTLGSYESNVRNNQMLSNNVLIPDIGCYNCGQSDHIQKYCTFEKNHERISKNFLMKMKNKNQVNNESGYFSPFNNNQQQQQSANASLNNNNSHFSNNNFRNNH